MCHLIWSSQRKIWFELELSHKLLAPFWHLEKHPKEKQLRDRPFCALKCSHSSSKVRKRPSQHMFFSPPGMGDPAGARKAIKGHYQTSFKDCCSGERAKTKE